MDMRQLFDDFKNHIESLSDDDIKQSIKNTIEHSCNSLLLKGKTELKEQNK